MHSRSLAGVVDKVVLSGLDNAGDGGDVDDGAGPAVIQGGALLQQSRKAMVLKKSWVTFVRKTCSHSSNVLDECWKSSCWSF